MTDLATGTPAQTPTGRAPAPPAASWVMGRSARWQNGDPEPGEDHARAAMALGPPLAALSGLSAAGAGPAALPALVRSIRLAVRLLRDHRGAARTTGPSPGAGNRAVNWPSGGRGASGSTRP